MLALISHFTEPVTQTQVTTITKMTKRKHSELEAMSFLDGTHAIDEETIDELPENDADVNGAGLVRVV